MTELRRELLRRPLGIDFTADELALERADTHLAAVEDGRLVGTLLLRSVDERTARILRMAVAADRADMVRNPSCGGQSITTTS